MSTPLGTRTVELLRQQNWDELKQDRELCTWLATHCVLCGSWTGTLRKSNSQHATEITDLFSKASDLLLQIAGQPPYDCPLSLCSKTVVQVAQQLYLVKKHGLQHQAPLPDPAPAPPGKGYIAFLMPRDSVNATPECQRCHHTFETMTGLHMRINKGKCASFDAQRTTITRPADPILLEALTNGHLWEHLLQTTVRVELTLRCQLCGVAYSTPAQLMLRPQTAHGPQQVQAQEWLGYLQRHLGPPTHCYCNPAPSQLYSNHVCVPLRQISMLFDKLQVEQQPAIFAPSMFHEVLLRANLHHALPDSFIDQVAQYLVERNFEALLRDPSVHQVLGTTCLCCGVDYSIVALTQHLQQRRSHLLMGAYALCGYVANNVIRLSLPDIAANTQRCPLCSFDFGRCATPQGHLVVCPIVHQLCLLVTSTTHGNRAAYRDCSNGDRGRPLGIGGGLESSGPGFGTELPENAQLETSSRRPWERQKAEDRSGTNRQGKRQRQGQTQETGALQQTSIRTCSTSSRPWANLW